MYRQLKASKMMALVLVCMLTGLFLASCSTVDKVKAFFSSRQSQEAKSDEVRAKSVQFFSNVRAPRGNPDSHYLLGRYYYEQGRYKEALEEFRKAATIKPDFAKAHNGMGACYDHLQQFAKAREAYTLALKLEPEPAYVHNNLGCSYYEQNDYGAAIEELKKAIQLDQTNRRFHTNLGMAYASSEQYALAIEEFELAGKTDMARQYAEEMERLSKPATSHVVEESSPPAAGNLSARKVAIEISNGNGINNMARQVGEYLKQKGFNVVRYTNADSFDHSATTIQYQKEGAETIQELRNELPEIQELQKVSRMDRQHVKVKLIMGRDPIPRKDMFAQRR